MTEPHFTIRASLVCPPTANGRSATSTASNRNLRHSPRRPPLSRAQHPHYTTALDIATCVIAANTSHALLQNHNLRHPPAPTQELAKAQGN